MGLIFPSGSVAVGGSGGPDLRDAGDGLGGTVQVECDDVEDESQAIPMRRVMNLPGAGGRGRSP